MGANSMASIAIGLILMMWALYMAPDYPKNVINIFSFICVPEHLVIDALTYLNLIQSKEWKWCILIGHLDSHRCLFLAATRADREKSPVRDILGNLICLFRLKLCGVVGECKLSPSLHSRQLSLTRQNKFKVHRISPLKWVSMQ